MKLLPKQEIQDLKAKQRKAEIDEGVKLAKKVDSLREMASKEQATIEKFQKESLNNLRSEIQKLIDLRDSIIEEIKGIKEEKIAVIVELDEREKEIDKRESGLRLLKKIIEDKEIELDFREKEQGDIIKEINEIKGKVIIQMEESNEILSKSREELIIASDMSSKSKQKLIDVDKYFEAKSKELLEKETSLLSKEQDLKIIDSRLSKKEIELNDRDKSIQDRYQTLLKTEKRLNI